MSEVKQRSPVRFFRGDRQIWIIVASLAVISVVTVFSASATRAYRLHGGDTNFYLVKQLIHLGLGIAAMFILQMIPTRLYKPFATMLLLGGVALLALTLLNRNASNNADRWYEIYGMQLQTSDLVRVPFVLFLATRLAATQVRLRDFRNGVLPLAGWIMLVCGLILPANLSTALLFGVTGGVLLLVGRVRWSHLLLLLCIGIGALALAFFVLPKVYPNNRVATWTNRLIAFRDGEGGSDLFQAHQAKIAVAGGLLWGKGPGNSTQRLILPDADVDFVYAIILEEGGLLMGIIVVLLYLWLLWRVRVIVRRSNNPYHIYLCVGLVFMIVLQAFTHILISVGLMPVTGLPLPFVSRGGTSLIVTGIALGMIQSVARQQRKEDLYAAEEFEG